VKWCHILELAGSCRKLLDEKEGKLPSDADRMNIDETFGESSKAFALPDFGTLARQLRVRDESALAELACMMESSDRMTNHEFVTFVLPALHAALFDTNGVTGNGQFCFKALEAFTTVVESPAAAEPSQHGDDETQMSVEEMPSQDEDVRMEESFIPAPMSLANRVPSIGLRRMQDILSFSENMSVLHVLWDKKRNDVPMSPNGSMLKSLTKPIELKFSSWRSPHLASSSAASIKETTVFVEPLLPSKELERHVLRSGTIENETYLSFCRR
jgi:hypothetical protein